MADLFDALCVHRAHLVEGAVALEFHGLDTPGSVLATALWSMFEAEDELRGAAAVQRYLADEASGTDLYRLAEPFDADDVSGLVTRYRDACTPGGKRTRLIETVAGVDEDAAALVVGAANVTVVANNDGINGPDDVIDATVGQFFTTVSRSATLRLRSDTTRHRSRRGWRRGWLESGRGLRWSGC